MRITTPIFVALIALSGLLSGCKSRPELRQVSSDAETHQINSQEMAQSLRDKYEK